MHKSYIVDPETGKLLTAQEWKDKAGDNVNTAKMVAIVPDDGSPAFAFPVETFDDRDWFKAMELAEAYKAPHIIEGSDGAFTLPTRKQGLDFRIARESGLEQLLEMIGADALLEQIKSNWHWTREKFVPRGTSEVRWSCVCISSSHAWPYNGGGVSNSGGFGYSLTVRPVTLLNSLDLESCGVVAPARAAVNLQIVEDMATMKAGQSIGLTDSLMRDIHVGDLIQDATGARYSIDRYGRAKPTNGGNEVPVKNLEGVEVLDPAQITPPHTDPEKEAVEQIHAAIRDAGDQTLVDELRLRGWTVICSKKVEKVVFETVEI